MSQGAIGETPQKPGSYIELEQDFGLGSPNFWSLSAKRLHRCQRVRYGFAKQQAVAIVLKVKQNFRAATLDIWPRVYCTATIIDCAEAKPE